MQQKHKAKQRYAAPWLLTARRLTKVMNAVISNTQSSAAASHNDDLALTYITIGKNVISHEVLRGLMLVD